MLTGFHSIAEAAAALRSGATSSVELTGALLERIRSVRGLDAFATVDGEGALRQAAEADLRLQAGDTEQPLCGVPIGVSQMIPLAPQAPGVLAHRLMRAGAVVLGALAAHEFAIDGAHDAPPPINPWGADAWAGGPACGAGAAIAGRLCFGAYATDTGGGPRVAAAVCGATALKPSHGRVPHHGIQPLAPCLDVAGVVALSVADLAHLFAAAVDEPAANGVAAGPLGATLIIGVDKRVLGARGEQACALHAALDVLAAQGAEVRAVALPDDSLLADRWMDLLAAEAAHQHSRSDRADHFGPALMGAVSAGRNVPALGYLQARAAARAHPIALNAIFHEHDCLVAPVTPWPDIGAAQMAGTATGGPARVALLGLNAPCNMTGHPSLVLPAGVSAAGLPLSLQLIGRHGDDWRLLRIGSLFQGVSSWHVRRPPAQETFPLAAALRKRG